MNNSNRERFLYHEAGHAIAAYKAGIPILFVAQVGDSSGMLQLSNFSAAQLKDESFRESLTRTVLAGAAAEANKFSDGVLPSLMYGLGRDDFSKLLAHGFLKDTRSVLVECSKALRFVESNWEEIEQVVSELRENLLLTETDIKAAASLPAQKLSKQRLKKKAMRELPKRIQQTGFSNARFGVVA